MSNFTFTYAKDKSSDKMVHVDSVPNGLDCNCECPNCGEPLIARHGHIKEHGFAHHSPTRRATLKICYLVSLYKLAAQILQQNKKIHVPSYHGIFKDHEIEFKDVTIEKLYDREDGQPDVIATGADGCTYLIQFAYNQKIRYQKRVPYKNLICLEINLFEHPMDHLENFLLHSNDDKKWVNHPMFFNSIERVYAEKGKRVRVTKKTVCKKCEIHNDCCAVRKGISFLEIENNRCIYRLCKPDERKKNQEQKNNEFIECIQRIPVQTSSPFPNQPNCQPNWEAIEPYKPIPTYNHNQKNKPSAKSNSSERGSTIIPPEERTCFMCKRNIQWRQHNPDYVSYASCGSYEIMGLPKKTPPETAKTCDGEVVLTYFKHTKYKKEC